MVEIRTGRLRLRPLQIDDAERIADLAGDYEVASMTARIPSPYSRDAALAWIGEASAADCGEQVFAIDHDGTLVGCCGIMPVLPETIKERSAVIGYWIGKTYWGNGFATEAAGAILRHALSDWKVEQICCDHFADNPASARVIEKLGFRYVKDIEINCTARGRKVAARHYAMKAAEAKKQPWYRGCVKQRAMR